MFHDQNLNLFLPFRTMYMFLHRPQLFHERLPRSPSRVIKLVLEGYPTGFSGSAEFRSFEGCNWVFVRKGGDVVLKIFWENVTAIVN